MSISTKLTATTAVCMLVATMAPAQTNGDTGSDAAAQKSPDTVTCADIAMMDTALVPGTLYYIAGYKHGSDKASSSDTNGNSATSDTGDASAESSASTTQNDTSLSENGATAPEDTATGDQPASSTDGSAAEGTANSDDAATPRVVRISGMFEIPVTDVMTVCGESPEKSVSDIVDQKRKETQADSK